MVVMRVDHPLANRSELDVADLADVEMVMLSHPSPYRDTLKQVFARQAVPIRSRLEVLTQRGAVAMAIASGMVALVDQEIAEEMAFRDLTIHAAAFTSASPWEVAVLHRRDRPLSLVAEAVLQRLKLATSEFQPAG